MKNMIISRHQFDKLIHRTWNIRTEIQKYLRIEEIEWNIEVCMKMLHLSAY